ncbi:protoheme IX farnesyltransferase [Deferribacterales bacterium Es71-Z0220]|uniref:protoheme IX farnesyltransferase n=1 Tax=Deferrivibrio essentukiensis TaxID=2880922 RepID=UPI001F62307E|nr:protoheme IX farnesyltransferase [Deferrivibrio essentukiensis]
MALFTQLPNIFKLIRLNISLMVTISAYFGFLLTGGKYTSNLLIVLLAVMIHSFGTSMLNQYQEVESDKKMERTKKRPLPKYIFDSKKVLLVSMIFILLSFLLPIIIKKKFITLMLLDNFIIYNCIYTPLKKKTSFALLIGSFSGAIPPIIGWLAGNSSLSIEILLVATTFYMWQVPHFLFLTEKYKNEYKKAGFRILINETSAKKYNIILIVWLISYFLVLTNTAFIILRQGILSDIVISLETVLILILIIQDKKSNQKFHIINISILILIIFYIIKILSN